MKALSILIVLLVVTGCNNPKSYYQVSDFSTLEVYQSENGELFLEVFTGDSFTWLTDVDVTEKEDRILIKVAYTLNQSATKFIRNKNGNFIQQLETNDELDGKAVFYLDDSGMHSIETKEWREELMGPYVIPELSDPFEPQKAEPVGTGQPM